VVLAVPFFSQKINLNITEKKAIIFLNLKKITINYQIHIQKSKTVAY